MKTIAPLQLKAQLDRGEPVEIVDIRPRTRYAEAHIEGSHSLPACEICAETLLASRELLSSEPLYMVSESGTTAQRTACELEDQGYDNIIALSGGMRAWRQAALPAVTAARAQELISA